MSQLSRLIPTSGPGSGTVTSITFNGGLTSTPDPVTATGTATLDQTNLTVLDGTVYWDTGTQRLNTTATGTVGQFLRSGGAGVAPAYATLPSNAISITGDSGGALTGTAFTFTGGTTGLLFSGAGTTETLVGTLAVANGGTNATSFATTDGTVYFDGTRLVTTATGTAGQILTSNGAGVAPTYQTGTAGTISITGDSGGALTSSSFTFTGGTTGLTFAGAGSTETLGGTLVVSNGGTGRATLTSHGVLVGAGTSAITQLAVGTTGQVLTGVTGADPVFAAPAASSISITGNTGGALTGNAFTFTGGTTGLSFGGSGTTETLSGTLVVANGGTNATSFATTDGTIIFDGTRLVTLASTGTTGQALVSAGAGVAPAYGVLPIAGGGTNATSMANTDGVVYYDGTRLVTTAVGTATQVLTSNGAGVAPTFQAAGGSGVTSITGNTGGALTGALTFTGGTTGLSFGGSGTTQTLTFAGITANGGTVSLATDATTSTINIGTGAGAKTSTFGSTNTTSTTVISSGSGNIAMNTGLTVDSTGRNYNTKQPAFLATLNSSTSNNVTGDGTTYTIVFANTTFDQGSNFNTGTGVFTAPITGKYMFNTNVVLANVVAQTTGQCQIVTTGQTFEGQYNNPSLDYAPGNFFSMQNTVFATMTAGDTAKINIILSGSTKTVGVLGGAGGTYTRFSGFLVC